VINGPVSSGKTHPFLLFLILLMGVTCRFYNLNWDDGYNYHPDEMNITAVVSRITIPHQLDPGFFAYNGFPFYLYRAAAQLAATVTHDHAWTEAWARITLVGRFLSALFSTLSIYLIYRIGKKTITETAALLAAFLTAVAVGLIQAAHYGVTESLLLFLLLAIAACALDAVQKKAFVSLHWYTMAALCGLALGTKTSALSFLVIPCAAGALLFFREGDRRILWHAVPLCLAAFMVFCLVSPYSLLKFSAFADTMRYESDVVWGRVRVPYTLQFRNTQPYWFFFKNLHWHAGLVIPTAGFLGMALWFIAVVRKKEAVEALPLLLFGLLYWIYVGNWYAKFIRYTLLMLPLLILGTCWLLHRMVGYRWLKPLAVLLIAITLITSTLWAGAFISVYRSPATRTAASQWIYENVPPQSVILREHWDYGLPVHLAGREAPPFRFVIMNNYDPDSEEKMRAMSGMLEEGDYLIVASRRLSGSIGRAPDQYPLTASYYRKLFAGVLGYTLVQTFASYPTLWGITINDDEAEETFQVFDHPVVRIFKNNGRLQASRLLEILKQE
jgi:4-amino-4-deoxy-L-arabinose transferase-like glycosyltransferase